MQRIFISHHSSDRAVSAAVKSRLEARGYRSVFLDFDPDSGIAPGREWERELYQQIRSCQAMVVIGSRRSMESRWCFVEITHARAMGKPLFAIRVDDAPLGDVLSDRQAIDLTAGEEEAYARLFRGLQIAGLDPAKAFPWAGTRPPYPGLISFQEEDAAIFFGRGEEIAQGLELLNRIHHLGDPQVVMVLGASGTGKSSVVRAGLIPRLRRDPDRWLVVDPFRPRSDPARSLATALSGAFAAAGAPRSIEEIAASLRGESDDVLSDVLADLRRCGGRPDAKVLLVVDQFEELLTGDERSQDVERWLRGARRAVEHSDRAVVVLGTMRSDFLDRFQSHPQLLDLRYEVLSLGPMSIEDITEIIVGPAAEADVELGPGLVEALVADGSAPNALPLLAFALRELWERYGGDRRLTLDEYRDGLGGLQKVISRVAEGVLSSTRVTKASEDELRAAFLAMVRVTDDGRYARRVVNWSDLPPSIHPLLDLFVAARLLASGSDGEERTLEVAHERLFESWDRLAKWIAENLEALNLRHDIERTAANWALAPNPGEFLWHGGRVSRARELLSSGTLILEDRERDFIAASEEAERAEVAKREARRRREFIAVSIFAVVALLLAGAAFIFARRASSSAVAAEERARLADIARARALAAQNFAEHQRVIARSQAELDDDRRAALLAIAPKYLDQSKRHESRALELERGLEAWRREKGIAVETPRKVFSLEVMRASSGNAFFIHYGQPQSPRHMLIDGGMRRTYRDALRPRLEALRALHGGDRPIALDLVVSSQTDIQPMEGLIELLRDIQTAREKRAASPANIGALWSTAFVPGEGETAQALAKLWGKGRLVGSAKELGIPVNAPFTRLVMRPEAGAARVNWDEGLSITILSPPVESMRKFAQFWMENWRRLAKSRRDRRFLVSDLTDYDILEDFASPRIELLTSPIEIVNPQAPGGTDKSVPNLASIVLMVELGGKRMLLPADARADQLLDSLAQAGYTDARGTMDVDVMVLPHGGSDRNVSVEFFRRIKARSYVVSADGTYDNPEVATFRMLFEARRGDPRPFTVGLTYAPEELTNQSRDYPVDELCRLFREARSQNVPFEIVTPAKGQHSFGIDLWLPTTFVPEGAVNTVCR